MAIPRSDERHEVAESPCSSCKGEEAGNRYFVPWSESGASGRWLCYACLMTAWRIDTQREVERYRLTARARLGRSGYR
jgi:hypothetical protein